MVKRPCVRTAAMKAELADMRMSFAGSTDLPLVLVVRP